MHVTPELLTAILGWAGFAFSLVRWLAERKLLPARVRKVFAAVPETKVLAVIRDAQTMVGIKSDEDKRQYAIKRIMALLVQQGIDLPEGFIRLAVEYVYQQVMKGRL